MDLPNWLPFLSTYFVVTLQLSAISTLISVPVAVGLALCRLSGPRWLRLAARIETDLFRSIPLLALLLFLYFDVGPAVVFLGSASAFWLAVLGLTLNTSAYVAEVYRGALEAVPAGQWDAAASIGMNWRQTVIHVVLPQAIPTGLPTTVNLLVLTIKESSLASLIAVKELMMGATVLASETFMSMDVYLLVGLMYLVLVIPISYLAQYTEGIVARRFGLSVVAEIVPGSRGVLPGRGVRKTDR